MAIDATNAIGAHRIPLGAPGLREAGAPAANPEVSKPDAAKQAEGFAEALDGAVEELNDGQAAADATVQDFLEGEDVPVHQVMIALSQADLSMRLATAVTSRAIAAYQEIARMQV